MISTYNDVTPEQFRDFLNKAYPEKPEKVEFLMQHGEWLHRGNHNRLVILANGNGGIAAHSGVIPAPYALHGQRYEGVWMMDLFVLAEHRGHGYQRELEQHICGLRPTTLAFTNELSTQIFQKHGWDADQRGSYYILPLRLMALKKKFFARGLTGQLVKLKTALTAFMSASTRRALAHYEPKFTREIQQPDAQALADVFLKHHDLHNLTTYRDADYIQWRFLDAPFRAQYRFYEAGTVAAVVREARFMDGKESRLLDIWGDLSDVVRLDDVLKTVVRDALHAGSLRVMGISAVPTLAQRMESLGFRRDIPRLFCWISAEQQAAIGQVPYHWSLADSDNDTVG